MHKCEACRVINNVKSKRASSQDTQAKAKRTLLSSVCVCVCWSTTDAAITANLMRNNSFRVDSVQKVFGAQISGISAAGKAGECRGKVCPQADGRERETATEKGTGTEACWRFYCCGGQWISRKTLEHLAYPIPVPLCKGLPLTPFEGWPSTRWEGGLVIVFLIEDCQRSERCL